MCGGAVKNLYFRSRKLHKIYSTNPWPCMNFFGALPLPISNIAKFKEKMTNRESRTYDSKRLMQKPCITCTIKVKMSGKFTSTVVELFHVW